MTFQVVSKIRSLKEELDAVRAPKQGNNLYYHCRIKQEWSYRMDFHARVWKSDQGGWNSMQGMEIYPVHGISTRGWMEIQPSASKYLDGNPTKLFKDTQ